MAIVAANAFLLFYLCTAHLDYIVHCTCGLFEEKRWNQTDRAVGVLTRGRKNPLLKASGLKKLRSRGAVLGRGGPSDVRQAPFPGRMCRRGRPCPSGGPISPLPEAPFSRLRARGRSGGSGGMGVEGKPPPRLPSPRGSSDPPRKSPRPAMARPSRDHVESRRARSPLSPSTWSPRHGPDHVAAPRTSRPLRRLGRARSRGEGGRGRLETPPRARARALPLLLLPRAHPTPF